MRKNGNMFEWAIEVAVVVAIVLLLMGVCFWVVPHLQKTDRSASPAFSVFDVEDAQSKRGSVLQSDDMDGGIDDVIFHGKGVVTSLDAAALIACIRITSEDSYGLELGGEYRFNFDERFEQVKLTLDGVDVGSVVDFRYRAITCDKEGTLVGEFITLAL